MHFTRGYRMGFWTPHKALILPGLVLLLVLLTGCAAGVSQNYTGGWWGSKQDREVVSQEDIRKFVGGVRPLQQDASTHFSQGIDYQRIGRHESAVQEFERALQQEPEHIKALNGLGVSSDRLGDFQTAESSYQKALELNPDLDYVYNNLGYSYLMQQEYAKAKECFEKALELNSSQVYRNNLGLAYARQGRFEQALEQYQGRLERKQDSKAGPAVGPGGGKQPKMASAGQQGIGFEALRPSGLPSQARQANRPAQERKVAKAPKAGRELEDPEPKASKEPSLVPALVPDSVPENQLSAKASREQAQKKAKPLRKGAEGQENFYAVQTGAFRQQKQASEAYFRLVQNGYQAYINPPPAGSRLYRVRVGQFESRAQAKQVSRQLSEARSMETLAVTEKRPPKPEEMGASLSKVSPAGLRIQQASLQQGDEHRQELDLEAAVDILNGNGVNRMAARLGSYLQTQGLEVSRIRNADHFRYEQTSIYFRPGQRGKAELLASLLPIQCELRKAHTLALPQGKLRLVFGRDLARHGQGLDSALRAEAEGSGQSRAFQAI